jgi:hypothetical protein
MKKLSSCNRFLYAGGAGLTLILFACFTAGAHGQASEVNPTNDLGLPTDFLGWEPGVTSTLHIRHNTTDQPIIFAMDGATDDLMDPFFRKVYSERNLYLSR